MRGSFYACGVRRFNEQPRRAQAQQESFGLALHAAVERREDCGFLGRASSGDVDEAKRLARCGEAAECANRGIKAISFVIVM